jgi:hypothetical protein
MKQQTHYKKECMYVCMILLNCSFIGDRLNFPRAHHGETTRTSSNSSGSGGYSNRHGSTIPSGSSGLSSGSPNSGSCSDSGRTENKDSGIASGIPSVPAQAVIAVPSAGIKLYKFIVQISCNPVFITKKPQYYVDSNLDSQP